MTDDLPTIPQEAKTEKKSRISKRMKQVLTLLATKGMTQRDAAKQVGMSETYLSAALKKPEIQMFIARKAREKMAVGMLRASSRLLELMDCDSAPTSFDASKHVLAIGGVKPSADAAVNVNIEIKAGYVIDLSPEPGERLPPQRGPLIDVTPVAPAVSSVFGSAPGRPRQRPEPAPDPYPVFRPRDPWD